MGCVIDSWLIGWYMVHRMDWRVGGLVGGMCDV